MTDGSLLSAVRAESKRYLEVTVEKRKALFRKQYQELRGLGLSPDECRVGSHFGELKYKQLLVDIAQEKEYPKPSKIIKCNERLVNGKWVAPPP